jgi:hypothetical protein
MVLAFGAFLAVAGPGVLLAAPPTPAYSRPVYGDINGSGPAGPFSLVVHFSTDATGVETPVSGHFSARNGTINSDGTGFAPVDASLHKALIFADYSNSNGSVHVSKLITF